MNEARISKMAHNVAADMRPDAKADSDDEALSNVDQALDAMLAAVKTLADNLPQIKVENVPQKAAVDTVQDLLDTALVPYLADVLKAMQVFGK